MSEIEYSAQGFGVEHYSPRLRWHMQKTLEGVYGAVLSDIRSLPVVDDAEVSRLEETYRYLARYYQEGVEDSERAKILRQIGTSLMRILRANAAHLEYQEQPWSSWSSARGTLKAYGYSEDAILSLINALRSNSVAHSREYFDKLDQLFGLLWTSVDLTEAEGQALRSLLLVEESSTLVAQTVVGALFLGTMQYFDPLKMQLLYELWQEHPSVMVEGAALGALLILSRRHSVELCQLHPHFVEQVRLAMLLDEKQLLDVLHVIQVSYKTTENHKIFREKILPELRSISDKMQQVMGNSLTTRIEELQNGAIDREKLEEVESLMAKAPDKFSMMKDTEQDVSFHLVSELKGFPFFSKVSHWFMPFDDRFPGLSRENVAAFKQILPMMMQGQRMISSDLYSYALVPAWEQMGASILSQMEGAMPTVTPTAPSIIDGVKDFVFGAYRFYALSHHAHTLINPFDGSPYILNGAFLASRRAISEEGLLSLATMMVRFGQYADAGSTYERVVRDYLTNTAEVWRGMAVASMMRNDDEKALYQLRRAVELEGKNEVTVRKIAQILVRLGRKEEAVEWITEGEGELHESISYQLPLLRARLLLELGREEEALKAAFKANYLADGKDPRATSLLTELRLKLGKAKEIYDALSNKEIEGEPLLWLGLASLATGKRTQGLASLRKWHATGSKGSGLHEKLPLLSRYGIEGWEQALIEDIIYRKEQ